MAFLKEWNPKNMFPKNSSNLRKILTPHTASVHWDAKKLPTVFVATLVRNKAHTLPYFLSYFEKLTYPKDRIYLWIRSDHNEDESIELLQLWITRKAELYHYIDFEFSQLPKRHRNESSTTDWPRERFEHIIHLKEKALETAKSIWADYILFLDADVFLTDPQTLNLLVHYDLPIVSPMLLSESLYSNFWCAMSEEYYYERTDEYKQIYNYEKLGAFSVPMVHTALLVNLNYKLSHSLTFDPKKLVNYQKTLSYMKRFDGPLDDIIVFAVSANSSGLKMYVSNEIIFGYLLAPLGKDDAFRKDYQQLDNVKLMIVNNLNRRMCINEEFQMRLAQQEKHKLSLDKIYMINLKRRLERRQKMALSFDVLGLEIEYFEAVDGKNLTAESIKESGIEFLSGYEDPYHRRKMTMGEIGCFLSHYRIWKQIVDRSEKEVLILEDDIKFEPYFNANAVSVLDQARKIGNWDLIYFGRKKLEDEEEPCVENVENLVHVGYSYWTLGYAITLEGARKLIQQEPLKKLLPVDEFLPIMFGRHPNDTWSSQFEPKNLIAYSSAPLLVYPTHYTNDEGYISDTEDSDVASFNQSSDVTAPLKSDKGMQTPEQYQPSLLVEKNLDSAIINQMKESLKHAKNEL